MDRRYDLGKLGTVLAVLTNRVTKDMRCIGSWHYDSCGQLNNYGDGAIHGNE